MKTLVQHLIANGADPALAADLAKGYNPETETPDVDVERLSKALEGVRAQVLEAPPAKETIEKAIAGVDAQLEIMAKGSDALLTETREQNEAIAKGLLAVGETMKSIAGAVSRIQTKLLGDNAEMAKALNAPLPPRAVSGAAPTASPQEATGGESRQDFLTKSIQIVNDDTQPHSVRSAHQQAIVFVESANGSVADARQQYGIH